MSNSTQNIPTPKSLVEIINKGVKENKKTVTVPMANWELIKTMVEKLKLTL